MTINVGDTITGNSIYDAPPGTRFGSGNEQYVRTYSGVMKTEGLQSYTAYPNEVYRSRYTVLAVEPVQVPYDLFRQWLATTLRGMSAYNGGGYYEACERALPRMGAIDPDPGIIPGTFLHPNDTRLHAIPDSTVVDLGGDEFGHRTVLAHRGGAWVPVIGSFRGTQYAGRVLSVPGVTERFDPQYQEGDEQRIAQFKAKVWAIGWRAKVDGGWCETYESVMHQLGMTSHVEAAGIRWGDIGSVGGRAQMAALPTGTVISAASGDWGLFIRDDAIPDGLHLLVGADGDTRNSPRQGTIVHLPGGEVSIPIASVNWLRHMPMDTVISHSGYSYRRDRNVGDREARAWIGHSANAVGSTHRWDAFSTQYRITVLPGVE